MTIFSTQEIDIASDPITLLIKNRVMEKAVSLMGNMEEIIVKAFETADLPPEINRINGKISRGEQYKFLPYVLLDCPAYFSKTDVFAIRTMFYWGNFISITLHLKGTYLTRFGSQMIEVFKKHPSNYFCVHHTEWEYDYSPMNYQTFESLSKETIQEQLTEHGFIKISTKIPIEEVHQTEEMVESFVGEILKVI